MHIRTYPYARWSGSCLLLHCTACTFGAAPSRCAGFASRPCFPLKEISPRWVGEVGISCTWGVAGGRAGRVPDPLERTGRGAQRLFPCSLATFPATAAGQFVGAFQLPPTLCVKCTYRQPLLTNSPPPPTACIERTTEQAHVCMLCSLSPLLMRCRHIPAPSYESREAGGGKRDEEGEATK